MCASWKNLGAGVHHDINSTVPHLGGKPSHYHILYTGRVLWKVCILEGPRTWGKRTPWRHLYCTASRRLTNSLPQIVYREGIMDSVCILEEPRSWGEMTPWCQLYCTPRRLTLSLPQIVYREDTMGASWEDLGPGVRWHHVSSTIPQGG